MLGTVFAGHTIETILGRGGMGVVYRARHCRLDRVAALKVVAPELLEDASAQRRFREEATVAAALEHPNIVPVHDAGEADGTAYIAMRYVAGADLFLAARAGAPMPARRAAAIVADVAAALDALHGAGYVHRDVKPRNVLIARDGHVFLCDFGLACRVAGDPRATRTGHWAGTTDYAAPEQIRGGCPDARGDVYGLGCLLFFALTRRAPFARETVEAKLRAHLYEPPPAVSELRPDVPAAMDCVIARAMAKQPEDRFAAAGELGRAALAAAGGTGRDRCIAPECAVARAVASADATTVSRGEAPAAPGPMADGVAVT